MAEYIERTELIADMDHAILDIPSSETVDSLTIYAVLRDCACEAPAADVEPVRHGRWVPIQHYDSHDLFECSECGRRVDYAHCDYTVEDDYPYCHCGAKMDGEEVEP